MSKFKILVASFIFLAISSATQAQFRNILRSIDEAEVIGGLSLISFHDVEYETEFQHDTKLKPGYLIGIGTGWHLNEKIAIALKFLAESKGRSISYMIRYFDEDTQEFKIGEAESIYNLNYLSASVTLKHLLGRKKRFFIEGGPYISYLLKAQAIINYLYDGTKTVTPVKEDFASVDFGITIAVGYYIPVKTDKGINLRLFSTYGIVDISHYPENISFQKAYTQSAGVSFSFVKKVSH
jgi:Outer membrane protein beta-barrel domain